MYLIINKTKKTNKVCGGDFPNLDEDLNNGDKIIVVSYYSNTIKVPHYTLLNGIKEWEWEDFSLPEPFDLVC